MGRFLCRGRFLATGWVLRSRQILCRGQRLWCIGLCVLPCLPMHSLMRSPDPLPASCFHFILWCCSIEERVWLETSLCMYSLLCLYVCYLVCLLFTSLCCLVTPFHLFHPPCTTSHFAHALPVFLPTCMPECALHVCIPKHTIHFSSVCVHFTVACVLCLPICPLQGSV